MKYQFWGGVVGCLLVAGVCGLPSFAAEEESEPKYNIKGVMKDAFKGPLIKKVAAGDASDEEKKTLHAMVVAMSKAEPKKGEADSWKEKTTALMVAAKAAVDGDEKAPMLLKEASNCKACHSLHK